MVYSKQKPKIQIGVFIGCSPASGGMFQYTQTILEALVFLRNEGVSIVAIYIHSEWAPLLSAMNIEACSSQWSRLGVLLADIFMFFRVPIGVAKYLGGIINPLIKSLMRKKVDVWIFPAQDQLTWQIPANCIVGVIHDLMHRYESRFPEVRQTGRVDIRDFRFKSIVNSSKLILTESLVGKNQVVESYGVDAHKIFPLPYIPPGHIRNPEDLLDFEKTYSLPKKFLFYPAQFWEHKNHSRLIDAVKKALPQCEGLQLVLTGSYRHSYQALLDYARSENLDDVIHFIGYVPNEDLVGFYSRSYALIYPSFFGPTNIPPLEAMELGCPVLVSNIYAMPEQCGNAALYFNPHSVEEIAQCIKRIWNDPKLHSSLMANALLRRRQHTLEGFAKGLGVAIDQALAS